MPQQPSVPFSEWKEYTVVTLEILQNLTVTVTALVDALSQAPELVLALPAALVRAENDPQVLALRETLARLRTLSTATIDSVDSGSTLQQGNRDRP